MQVLSCMEVQQFFKPIMFLSQLLVHSGIKVQVFFFDHGLPSKQCSYGDLSPSQLNNKQKMNSNLKLGWHKKDAT